MFSFFKTDSSKNTIAVLDGVRAIAALAVLGFHLNLIAHNDLKLWNFSIGSVISALALSGGAGVTLFFVLSGFLLFLPYAKSLLFNKDWPSIRQFYLRRALRIWPGYYVCLFTLILLFQPQYLQPAYWKRLLLFLSFFMDSSTKTYQAINGPFWTLAVEWQFYLLLPLLALLPLLMAKLVPLRRRLWVVVAFLLGLMAWGVGSRYIALYYIQHPMQTLLVPRPALNWILFFLYGTNGKFLEDFAVGMLLCTLYVYARQAASDHPLSKKLHAASWWIFAVGLGVLFFAALWHFNNWFHSGLRFLNPISDAFTQWGELTFATGFGLCILAVLFGPQLLKMPFEWQPLRWLGMISYSMYMWHLYILESFKENLRPLTQSWSHLLLYSLLWVCALFIVLPFSYALYKWVEVPGIRLANGLRLQKTRVATGAITVPASEPVTPKQQAEITRSQW